MARFKLVFFSPVKSTPAILSHLFAKYPQNLGRIGEYEQCAFMAPGTGQFRPSANANPVIGTKGQLEYVEEHRVEVVVHDEENNEQIRSVIAELKKAHPYEEVAYDVYRLEEF
ncbi:hypothetical protein EIP91_006530 [Steccherinum ochraceum]|uniref:ATP phosphoribosyltransferase n=1 Tax=Steccherinum ochraceum TaxID=92696 RepID=A0A4R0RBE4_9APHY|nr:hypothetical protein EIP91_006530 [Steccherinum ochraceum]